MKTTEINDSIIGKRCKSIFTGMMVTGIIEEINITEHSASVKVRFDKRHNWGKEWYEYDWSFGRFCDEFGSLQYLEIIDDLYETIRVTFLQTIQEINEMFVRDYAQWHVVNLKEWIDSYESSRFTQIDEKSAIITSEYNMVHIKEWFEKMAMTEVIEILY